MLEQRPIQVTDARVPVPHSHDAFDETAYVLEGTMTFTVDGEVV